MHQSLGYVLTSLLLSLIVRLCDGNCNASTGYFCTLNTVNLVSGGQQKIRTLLNSATQITIIKIEHLIVPVTAAGKNLLSLSTIAHSIFYQRYLEAEFLVPSGTVFMEISVKNAPNLRSFIIGEDCQVTVLTLEQTSLDRIPPTVGTMRKLAQLRLINNKLTRLQLDVLTRTHDLLRLDVSKNQIAQLLTSSSTWGNSAAAGIALTWLDLSDNVLESIDLAMFAPLTRLERLMVLRNRLVRLGSSNPIMLPSLKFLMVEQNNLTTLNWDGLVRLPKLGVLSLSKNGFEDVPKSWGTLNDLYAVMMENNRVRTFDLVALRPLPTLQQIYLPRNQITSVQFSGTNCDLPPLNTINLSTNQIKSFNIRGCPLPKLSSLMLSSNQLQAVPASVLKSELNLSVLMSLNPLRCTNLKQYTRQIIDNTLYTDFLMHGITSCPNGSFFIAEVNRTVCCVDKP
ncbi:leucine-rich repeat protein SHOC-2-like [Anopheles aquasalis]|uniref:leucine-rich repeat protein SHOC-2-like n=1 Tax=Anopheles aquasalis TaxID=42839 RepID=UPI00215AAD4D|nr:leucine-rich repeat protein SHOC-2-like [Anopheles aquasalis]